MSNATIAAKDFPALPVFTSEAAGIWSERRGKKLNV
jgi:hypothetical protein